MHYSVLTISKFNNELHKNSINEIHQRKCKNSNKVDYYFGLRIFKNK